VPDAEPAREADAPDAEPVDAGGPTPFVPVNVPTDPTRPHPTLSTWALLRWNVDHVEHNVGVEPYTLGMALFSDYAVKARAFWLPPNTQLTYVADEVLDFPVGSVITKSFLFPADMRQPTVGQRMIEKRVLVRFASGWRAYPYVWRPDGSDADYRPSGTSQQIGFVDPEGQPRTAQCLAPQRNQCLQCHQLRDPSTGLFTTPIGPKIRHLDHEVDRAGLRVNQLEDWAMRGLLAGLPPMSGLPADFDEQRLVATGTVGLTPVELEKAARDYLDVNCAHCHQRNATQGVTSQLFLDVFETDPFHYGVCKEPGSAGRGTGGFRFDIVPGSPETSILHYRVRTATVGDMMPLIGRSLTHTMGARLLGAWIASMPPDSCE
jgi:uncharacterized repeat protein (TIGR03806 family)